MSFLRHGGIYRSDGFVPLGVNGFAHPQRSSASMSSRRLFLGRLLSSRACLRFAGQDRFSNNQTLPYNDFSANGNNPLNFLSQPKGAVQVVSHPPPSLKPSSILAETGWREGISRLAALAGPTARRGRWDRPSSRLQAQRPQGHFAPSRSVSWFSKIEHNSSNGQLTTGRWRLSASWDAKIQYGLRFRKGKSLVPLWYHKPDIGKELWLGWAVDGQRAIRKESYRPNLR